MHLRPGLWSHQSLLVRAPQLQQAPVATSEVHQLFPRPTLCGSTAHTTVTVE